MPNRILLSLSLAALAIVTVSAENWPAWRGPRANGVSGEKRLPTKWSTADNIAWKLAVPSRSGATPIIWNNHIPERRHRDDDGRSGALPWTA